MKEQASNLFRWILIAAVAAPALALAVSVEDGVNRPESDYSSVNGSVTIGDDAHVGDLDTVNGSIRLGSRSRAARVESVNGSIDIADGAEVDAIEAVNGGIELDRDVRVRDGIESVNGRIRSLQGTRIGGSVKTVNGGIDLDGTTVEGDLVTYQGAVELRASEIAGDLRVRKPRMGSWFSREKATVVRIGAGTVIHGDLYFEKKVKLSIADSAKVGAIHGDQVEMVEGDRTYK